jgi:hypothetical protein
MYADNRGEESRITRGNDNSSNDGRICVHDIHYRDLTFSQQFNIR